MKQKYFGISAAADYLGVSKDTLRLWERKGKIKPHRTTGNTRRYTVEDLDNAINGIKPTAKKQDKITIGYCRVSSRDQKKDLEYQVNVVTKYCEKQGYRFKIIKDLGSGMNYTKRGLQQLLHLVCQDQCDRIIINYKDRLVRFGYELIETVCREPNVQIETINSTESLDDKEELANDVMAVLTVFAARAYGKRSHKNKQFMNKEREMITDAEASKTSKNS